MLAALDDGDCWVEFEDLLDRANTLLVMDTLDSREVIEGHLEALIARRAACLSAIRAVGSCRSGDSPHGDGTRRSPDDRRASAARTLSAEVEHLLDAEGGELNPEQRDAVRNALSFSISLMTGGAGSGKTYAVSTITSIAERLELKVVLGRAHWQGRQTPRGSSRPRGEHHSSAAGFQRPHVFAGRAEPD